MNGKYNYERDEWIKKQQEKINGFHNDIKQMAENYKQKPETIAELMQFYSKFYKYSPNNNLLIKNQNPFSSFVASYKDWQDKGYNVKKGEKGIAIFVPIVSEVFKPIGEEEYKKLNQATNEEKRLIEKEQLKVKTVTNFRLGHVFDISQTDCPTKDYPKFFDMGYPSEEHSRLYDQVKEYSKNIGIPVHEKDLKSISLRGLFNFNNNEIFINSNLNDTERLSTLTHELGHAIMHKYNDKIPSEVKEYEADCISIMLQNKFSIEITDIRKAHLSEHYKLLNKDFDFDESLKRIGKTYSKVVEEMNPYLVSKQIEKEKVKEPMITANETINDKINTLGDQQNEINTIESGHFNNQQEVKSKPHKEKYQQYSKYENQAIIENIKQNIDIVELARSLGYTPVQEGSLYTLKEHDSLKLYPNTNSFARFSEQQSNGNYKGGSVIDLVMELNGISLQESIELLKKQVVSPTYAEIKRSTPIAEKHDVVTPFVLPQKVKGQYKRAYAYLTQTRGIDGNIVNEMMKRNHIYQDKYNNVVFCGKDKNDNIVYATRKSTYTKTEKPFPPLDVGGSNQKVGVFVNNNAPTLVVNEAFIDSLSYMTLLNLKGKDYNKQNYLALGGISSKPVIHHLKENKNIEKVVLALDNDETGIKTTQKIVEKINELLEELDRDIKVDVCVPYEKDFNEDLKNVRLKQEKKLTPSNEKLQFNEMEM